MSEDDPPAAALKQIEKEIADLLSKRDNLLRRIRGATCPVLPPDVLLEVFHHLLSDDNDSKTIIYPSHVSRLWRRTAIGAPFLWTRLLIGASEEGKDAATCAQRAGGCLMSLTMVERTSWPRKPSSKDFVLAVLEVTRSCRWEKICLSSRHTSDLEHLFGGCLDSENVAEVHTFSLTNRYSDSKEHSKAGIFDLQPYRALTSFTFDFRGQKHADIFSVPWQQLTYLKLVMAVDTAQHLQFLRQCVNLETCILKDGSRSRARHEPVHLLKLKRLEILETPDIIFDLHTPAIEELVLHSNSDDYGREELWDYLSSIGSTLRKIELPGEMMWQFPSFFKSLEVLEELVISGSLEGRWDDDFEDERMSHDQGVRVLLQDMLYSRPRLRTLELKDQWRPGDYIQDCLLQFVEDRIKHGNSTSLERVTYRLDKYAKRRIKEIATRFENLRKGGTITLDVES
ncbi:hypothetical protein NLJ89_g10270 [Agrocybe chaxingu]|uniref:F-box domain-containing protein n=1 Tax=Agrocybe chaxingu TaxID=84603 RepID=A0A9W8MP36_9AGAR|nr:hypothetical protein NLJ89_g10270 [Agrocybe chaxingu]